MTTQTRKPEFTGYMLSPEVDPAKNTRIAGFNHDAARINPTLIFAIPNADGQVVLQTMNLQQVNTRYDQVLMRIAETGGKDGRLNAAADMLLLAIEKAKDGKVKPWSGSLEELKARLLSAGSAAPVVAKKP